MGESGTEDLSFGPGTLFASGLPTRTEMEAIKAMFSNWHGVEVRRLFMMQDETGSWSVSAVISFQDKATATKALTHLNKLPLGEGYVLTLSWWDDNLRRLILQGMDTGKTFPTNPSKLPGAAPTAGLDDALTIQITRRQFLKFIDRNMSLNKLAGCTVRIRRKGGYAAAMFLGVDGNEAMLCEGWGYTKRVIQLISNTPIEEGEWQRFQEDMEMAGAPPLSKNAVANVRITKRIFMGSVQATFPLGVDKAVQASQPTRDNSLDRKHVATETNPEPANRSQMSEHEQPRTAPNKETEQSKQVSDRSAGVNENQAPSSDPHRAAEGGEAESAHAHAIGAVGEHRDNDNGKEEAERYGRGEGETQREKGKVRERQRDEPCEHDEAAQGSIRRDAEGHSSEDAPQHHDKANNGHGSKRERPSSRHEDHDHRGQKHRRVENVSGGSKPFFPSHRHRERSHGHSSGRSRRVHDNEDTEDSIPAEGKRAFIIGRGGTNIHWLRKRFNCEVEVDEDKDRIFLRGRRNSVRDLKQEVRRLINRGHKE